MRLTEEKAGSLLMSVAVGIGGGAGAGAEAEAEAGVVVGVEVVLSVGPVGGFVIGVGSGEVGAAAFSALSATDISYW